ncbi:UNVERIFIED_CONTAM: hypothetical protein Sindi_1938300 [Sesamum indicum]
MREEGTLSFSEWKALVVLGREDLPIWGPSVCSAATIPHYWETMQQLLEVGRLLKTWVKTSDRFYGDVSLSYHFYAAASCAFLHSRYLLEQDKGKATLMVDLMRETLSPGDKQLFSPLSREELERVGALYLFKATSVYEELSSRLQGTLPVPSSDAQRCKLEDRLERVGNGNAKLRETKKEVIGRCQQLEREVKQLRKEAASHEGTLKKAVEKAVTDLPYFEEGKNFLEAYCKSHLKEFKGSLEYQ